MMINPIQAAYEKERELFTIENLRAGIALITIGAAATALEYSSDIMPVHWHESTFIYDDLNGISVALYLATEVTIGLCQYSRSNRHVWHSHNPTSSESIIKQMPSHLHDDARRLAEQYLMVELDEGVDVPCITAVFWCDDGWWLTAGEPWSDVMDHGARDVLHPALSRIERALPSVQEILPISDRQLEAVHRLYLQLMAVAPARLTISVADLAGLHPVGPRDLDLGLELLREEFPMSGDDTRSFQGLPPFRTGSEAASRELLSNIGIDVI